MLVGDLEALMFERFPRERAEAWDRPGLTVGDPRAEVVAVACALDPTPTNVRATAALGANVLITHHPAFLDPPSQLTPEPATSSQAGAAAFEAARLGVSLVAMHTNLDRSEEALSLASSLLELSRTGRLVEPDGYGALLDAQGLTLGELADRAAAAFSCTPVVWGSESRRLGRVAFCSGSLGSLGSFAVSQGVDCVIAGEAGYHRTLELSEQGVAAILVGHDASELPYAGLLAQVVRDARPDTRIHILDEGLRWHAHVTEGGSHV